MSGHVLGWRERGGGGRDGAAQLARPRPSEHTVLSREGFWGYKLEVHAALWNPRTPSARVEGTPGLISAMRWAAGQEAP